MCEITVFQRNLDDRTCELDSEFSSRRDRDSESYIIMAVRARDFLSEVNTENCTGVQVMVSSSMII